VAAKALSHDEVAFGRAVLLATDAAGMSAEGAFWLFDRGDGVWHYFLVTSLFTRVGPREIYLRLNELFAKRLSEREAAGFNFYIAEPNEKLIVDLRGQIETEPYASEPKSKTVVVNGKRVRACVYRLAPRLDDAAAKTVHRRFRRLSHETVVA
jgi:hypothetical protein